ncbi:MAG: tetratricopeptide repeat protein [Phycisphaerae bacterium]
MQRTSPEQLTALEEALARKPDDLPLLSQLANALVNAQRPADALPFFERAFQLLPNDARLLNDRALALTALGRFDEARADLAAALQRVPGFAAAHNNLANLLIMMGRHAEAITHCDIALLLDENHASAMRNRAIAHLSLGHYAEGRGDYERACTRFPDSPPTLPNGVEWIDQPLEGKRLILLSHRHGLGDTLQFVRFAPQLKAKGARILLQCALPLVDLLRNAPGVDDVFPHDAPFPPAEYYIHLVTLLRALRIDLSNIPHSVPLLTADPALVARWRARLESLRKPKQRLIGIAWQGNPYHQWDQFRSAPLAAFLPLASLPGIQLVSLQRGPGTEQIAAFQQHSNNALFLPTTTAQSEPAHLADAAAIISNLDAIVTVDTFNAHLAGSLGKPVLLALSTVCDWRWLTDRTDSPWYPTMRLFRQRMLNDWPDLFERIAAHLRSSQFETVKS